MLAPHLTRPKSLVDAIQIIEIDEDADYDTQLGAWQFIAENGYHTQLQGFYGRGVHDLLSQGLIELPYPVGV